MRMGHVTIRTEYFDEELKFLKEIVGLHIVVDMRERGSDIVFLADSDGDTRIEVIKEEGVTVSGNEYISIGFETSDADALRKELIEKGIEAGPIISPAPVVKFFFLIDPAGVKIQFVAQAD